MRYYEPFQYAVVKGDIGERVREGIFIDGGSFMSLGRMRRSDIYRLQDRYGADRIKVVSDKRVCY